MRELKAFRPTQSQKVVLASILSAQTPKLAAEQISAKPNLKTARDMLGRLGLITFTDSQASLTDMGMALARDEGISDEGGQLTDVGQQLVGGNAQPPVNNMGMPEEEPPLGGLPPADDLGGGMPPMESFNLLRELMRI